MKKIILSGANGKMGRVIASIIKERSDMEVVCGFDKITDSYDSFPIFSSPDEYDGDCDGIIDFSHPSFTEVILNYAIKKNLPIVVATTGLSVDQICLVKNASESIPVFFSANMSMGVNLISKLAKQATEFLQDDFDIEVIEKHHNQKVDAPSGTAMMLADSIESALKYSPEFVYDRHTKRKKRDKKEIGMHSIRGGTIVGDHEIIFCGNDEIITISHTALSKNIFAVGAVNAIDFCIGQAKGIYDMSNMLN